MLTELEVRKLQPYYTAKGHGRVKHIEVFEHGENKREAILEYESTAKFRVNLSAPVLKFEKIEGITSIVENFVRGQHGDKLYRGNCAYSPFGKLFKHYGIEAVYDSMCGSQTIQQGCDNDGIECHSFDLNPKYGGIDVTKEGLAMRVGGDKRKWAVVAHWPYYSPPGCNIPKYSGKGNMWGDSVHPADMSHLDDYVKFMGAMNKGFANMYSDAEKGTVFIFLMGDTKFKGKYYSMLNGMNQYGTLLSIITKKQYNTWSDNITYNGSFIPIMHEFFVVLRKDDNFVIPCRIVKFITVNPLENAKEKGIESLQDHTWKSIIAHLVSKLGKATYDQIEDAIYAMPELAEKRKSNSNIRPKIRQIVNNYKMFKKDNDVVSLVA